MNVLTRALEGVPYLGAEPGIVLLSSQSPREELRLIKQHYPNAKFSVVNSSGDPNSGRHLDSEDNVQFFQAWDVDSFQRALNAIETPALIIDHHETSIAERNAIMGELIFNLRDAGFYLSTSALSTLPDTVPSVGRIVRSDSAHVLCQKSGSHAAKLFDIDANAALQSVHGKAWGECVLSVPQCEFVSRAVVSTNNKTLEARRFPRKLNVPELRLRRYDGALVQPGGVTSLGQHILTDSFRHHITLRLHNKHLVSTSKHHAVRPDATLQELMGSYFSIDNEHFGHFGHVMTEVISRMWAWPEVQKRDANAKILITGSGGYETLPSFVRTILEGYGVKPEQVEVLTEPRQVQHLYSATPQFQNPKYVSPNIADTWTAIARGIVPKPGPRTGKVFFDRAPDSGANSRNCHNSAEVRAYFVEAGFEIVRPELLSFTDQVKLVNSAKVLGGYAGSGLFTSALSIEPIDLVIVGSSSYDATNEHYISSVKGGKFQYFWGEADVPIGAGWSMEAMMSDFTFDVENDGPTLREVLRKYE